MDEAFVTQAGEGLSAASGFFANQKTEHLLNLSAGQKVEHTIKGFDKLKVFANAARWTGIAAIGIDVFSSAMGVKSTEEKMMDMIAALSEQISTLHKETHDLIKKHDEKTELGQSLGRLAEPISYIQQFQSEVSQYWSTESEFQQTNYDGMGNPGVILSRNISELHDKVRQIGNEFLGELSGTPVLEVLFEWSNGDFSEVNRLGRLCFDLVAAAPILEGTYWRIHCLSMSSSEMDAMMDQRVEEMKINKTYSDPPIGDEMSAATIIAESLQTWGSRCLTWGNLLSHHKTKAETIINSLAEDQDLLWPVTGNPTELHTMHEQVASRLCDELSAAYPFDWFVMVKGYGGEWQGEGTDFDCTFDKHKYVVTPLYENELKREYQNVVQLDIWVCAVDIRWTEGEELFEKESRAVWPFAIGKVRILREFAKKNTSDPYFFAVAKDGRNPEFAATFAMDREGILDFTEEYIGMVAKTEITPDHDRQWVVTDEDLLGFLNDG